MTETLDKLYLELSEISKAKTKREGKLVYRIEALLKSMKSLDKTKLSDDILFEMKQAGKVLDDYNGVGL